MDGFTKSSYWLHFIPYFIVFAAVTFIVALFLFWGFGLSGGKCFGCHFCFTVCACLLLPLVGLLLVILRLEGSLPSSFSYAIAFVFPSISVFLYIIYPMVVSRLCTRLLKFYPLFGEVMDMCLHSKNRFWFLFDSCCVRTTSASVCAVLPYAGLFLAFCLRKDGVFHTSYHFTLIPSYLFVLFLFILIVHTAYRGYLKTQSEIRMRRWDAMKERVFPVLMNALSGVTPLEQMTLDNAV